MLPLKALGKGPSLPLPASGNPQRSLACRHVPPTSAFTWHIFLSGNTPRAVSPCTEDTWSLHLAWTQPCLDRVPFILLFLAFLGPPTPSSCSHPRASPLAVPSVGKFTPNLGLDVIHQSHAASTISPWTESKVLAPPTITPPYFNSLHIYSTCLLIYLLVACFLVIM